MTTMPRQPAESHAAARTRPAGTSGHPGRQRRHRKRAHRHDPLSFAAGAVTGAGLALIWINIYAEVWPG